MKKYELTKETIKFKDKTLYRIKALKEFKNVKVSELGGYIESEDNLSQDGTCWVYGDAEVYDNAKIFDNAEVTGYAEVYGNAQVYNNAWIYGKAKIFDDARVYDNVQVRGKDKVYGNAKIHNQIDLENHLTKQRLIEAICNL